MIVAELIEFLKTQPQEMPVAYDMYSEYLLLDPAEIRIKELGIARADGWIESKRADKPSCFYLVFPGN